MVDRADGLSPRRPSRTHPDLQPRRTEGLADGIVVRPRTIPGGRGLQVQPTQRRSADTEITAPSKARPTSCLRAGSIWCASPLRASLRGSGTHDYTAAYVEDWPASWIWTSSAPPGCGWASIRWAVRASATGLPSATATAGPDDHQRDRRSEVRVHDRRLGRADQEDPSSPYAMAGLVALSDRFDVARQRRRRDRMGSSRGRQPHEPQDHFLSPRWLLVPHRDWRPDVAVGKTLVSTAMLDRVTADLGRRLLEVPSASSGSCRTRGRQPRLRWRGKRGASFLRRDGTVWTTDKDGLIACLLAAELTARLGRSPPRPTPS